MKAVLRKIAGSRGFWIGLILVVQTIVYIVAGMGKAYLHMDESYSLGLANYDRVEIQENADFYNHWHGAEYYRDYLTVDEDERGDFAPVYANQRDDVHPPLFYLLLRIGMEAVPGRVSKWPGLILNMVAFAVNSVFLYLIVERLLGGERERRAKAGLLTLAAAVTLAAVSTVVYIRMYALLAMWVTITAYLHLVLMARTREGAGWKLPVVIGVVAMLGVLTQYYYLIFLAPMFVVTVARYIRAKRWRELGWYAGALVVAAVVTLVIWPYAISHLFFGYRGQGAIGNLLNFAQLGIQVGIFLGLVTMYGFHYMLPGILVAMFALAIYGLKQRKSLEIEAGVDGEYRALLWPTLFYLGMVAVISPFTDLRYIEAVCGLAFVLVMVGLYWLVGVVTSERRRNIVLGVVLAVTALPPILLGIEPDVEYSRFREVVAAVEERRELPALYLYNMGNNRFLDDIVLFNMIEESYVMPGECGGDLDTVTAACGVVKCGEGEGFEPCETPREVYTVENFRRVLAGKDLAEGLLVFANYGYGEENLPYLEILQEATGLEEREYLFRLNAGAVYLLR